MIFCKYFTTCFELLKVRMLVNKYIVKNWNKYCHVIKMSNISF